ncbi:hypothetical protein BKA63DRAFT_142361 [Paraphoma chrysanthemicola]|nr:hypothetical protein BKA63DRAFT_142361 [Paraphoma chrysanthemicola]
MRGRFTRTIGLSMARHAAAATCRALENHADGGCDTERDDPQPQLVPEDPQSEKRWQRQESPGGKEMWTGCSLVLLRKHTLISSAKRVPNRDATLPFQHARMLPPVLPGPTSSI